ncbi:S-adenosyl-L-methionine-dependent methyltransferase [Fragilariopsis cylindrus CCMP1102]|uniref:S-adenosyl-L-methionine-dependent methyltransferase n=1 Tax=Fragilariopsis cylindrus CCMP1102 TaxID=635003 RepID=A0A1E7FCY7_9STRA|nr:S-adenosyl-L-methionine-dependent methyltransferase [Fragilariopsis cylindrus CCMP1102]|eukprot:OEU16030.1 S-adenosyl-L-methionine-dependent methyltransferase [Fragilariopsis cylindrus CCMP1102]
MYRKQQQWIRPQRQLYQHQYCKSSTSSALESSSTKQIIIPDTTTMIDIGQPPVFEIPKAFVTKPFDYHQQIIIEIESLTNMGWGIGRVSLKEQSNIIDTNDNKNEEEDDDEEEEEEERLWVIMVPHVLVGETVKVSIFRNMKGHSEADLIEVITSSPERVEPKCPLAGICGGCQYQHMSIKAQREWKTKHVEEVLLQQDITNYNTTEQLLVLSKPAAGTDEVYGYRSKITPHYQAPSDNFDGTYAMKEIGFQKSSNRNLVDVPECPIAMPAINEKYKEARGRLVDEAHRGLLNQVDPKKKKKRKRRGSKNNGGGKGATLLFRQADDEVEEDDDGISSTSPLVVTDHNQYMTTTIKNLRFRYLAGNFFQNNNYVVPLMVDAVVEAAIMPVINNIIDGNNKKSPSYLIDCYCGSGLFALSAASHFDLCVGIEVNPKAIEEATANAVSNDISNCQFMAASAEAIFTSPPEITISGFEQQRVQTFPREETVVIVDPPRKGCSEEFLNQLYDYSPQRIVYMSCGPATQARDAKGIVEIGGYEITSIQPFDLFPQTKHIESLIVFEKISS